MTAAVPLIAEALNLAITEQWRELLTLHVHHSDAERCREQGYRQSAPRHDEKFSEGIELLAVALHARLQEQGTLT